MLDFPYFYLTKGVYPTIKDYTQDADNFWVSKYNIKWSGEDIINFCKFELEQKKINDEFLLLKKKNQFLIIPQPTEQTAAV